MNVIALAEKLLGRARGSKYDEPDANPTLSSTWDQVVQALDSKLVVPLGAKPVEAALRKTLGNNLFFGTGYSTLERLSRLPISTMKIDQSFVREIQSNSRMFRIVRGMVDLARHVGMDVIAEGVESEEHFERLHAVGCERFQGYLFSRPMEAPCVRELLLANHLPVPDPITTFGNGSRWRTRVREVTGVSTTAEPT